MFGFFRRTHPAPGPAKAFLVKHAVFFRLFFKDADCSAKDANTLTGMAITTVLDRIDTDVEGRLDPVNREEEFLDELTEVAFGIYKRRFGRFPCGESCDCEKHSVPITPEGAEWL